MSSINQPIFRLIPPASFVSQPFQLQENIAGYAELIGAYRR